MLLISNVFVGNAHSDAPASHIIKMLITQEHFFHSTQERRCTQSQVGWEREMSRFVYFKADDRL
jgi:hypothetical protein